MRASTHCACRSAAWSAVKLVGVLRARRSGCRRRAARFDGVAGQHAGRDEPGPAGLERAVTVGVAGRRLVADVQHVGGDVDAADLVAAAPVDRSRRSTVHGGDDMEPGRPPVRRSGRCQHEHLARAGSPRTAAWRTRPTTCTGPGPGWSASRPAAIGDAPTRYGGIVEQHATRSGRGRPRRCRSASASWPHQFGVAHSAGHPDHARRRG